MSNCLFWARGVSFPLSQLRSSVLRTAVLCCLCKKKRLPPRRGCVCSFDQHHHIYYCFPRQIKILLATVLEVTNIWQKEVGFERRMISSHQTVANIQTIQYNPNSIMAVASNGYEYDIGNHGLSLWLPWNLVLQLRKIGTNARVWFRFEFMYVGLRNRVLN